MSDFDVAALLLTLTAGLAYVNTRFLRMPAAIGLMTTALIGSLALMLVESLGLVDAVSKVEGLLDRIDFDDALLHGMLGVLLFAGALHVDLADLRAERWTIGALALGGTLLSTALVGFGAYIVLGALGAPLPLTHCLVFGALISPTDPIAVLGILKSAGAPKRLEVSITGESLFNDGIGVVVFLVLAGVAAGGEVDAVEIGELFVHEALGGALFGLAVGYVGFRLLRSVDDYPVEILITLSMVFGGYAAAEALHLSAPITSVISGLVVGNHGRRLAMSDATRDHVDMFWELIDESLNAVLFLLIGLEVLHLEVSKPLVIAALAVIPLVLLARFVSVGLPVLALPRTRGAARSTSAILTWGGLRGGISVALALSLPAGPERETILFITYAVVVFSIFVQGLTLGKLIRALGAARGAKEA